MPANAFGTPQNFFQSLGNPFLNLAKYFPIFENLPVILGSLCPNPGNTFGNADAS
jgi:hypothetical protein